MASAGGSSVRSVWIELALSILVPTAAMNSHSTLKTTEVSTIEAYVFVRAEDPNINCVYKE